jgi:hypothetical protein
VRNTFIKGGKLKMLRKIRPEKEVLAIASPFREYRFEASLADEPGMPKTGFLNRVGPIKV